ncbi:hypothetical protein [Lactococcus lactis]|uniref:hypothetical protein n=1 Tax=Lactococcus lactis TaxID=1358 RepID=UPI0023A920BB|nr:hypothetical protein [Lactococcus lactis]WEA55746.1 hypothetical protein PWP91_03165 [Lactococcus lactis]
MSDLPKMLSKREIELEELEEARYVQSLRDDIEKLQERCDRYEKALTEAVEDIEQLNGSDDTIKYYKQALAAIGGDDE